MKPIDPTVLAINGGSSSIKFALYQTGAQLVRKIHGQIERIGLSGTNFSYGDSMVQRRGGFGIAAHDHRTAVDFLVDWLEKQEVLASIVAVGHRVVHGMEHSEPERVTQDLLDELHRIGSYDPEHLPGEIDLIEGFRKRCPGLLQVACFDTAFHRTMPRVATLLPIPRRYEAQGIRRYGFHGLSYSYLMEELGKIAGTSAAQGRVILAHLGNGASLAAVRDGKCIDTSMGFTPAGGLVMGSRTGDLDPGVAWHLMQKEKLTPEQFNRLINHQSGLAGVSETSSDMRDLMEHEAEDVRAAEAVSLFCYQTRKWIGAFAAALGGLDTLVFSAGIGENSPEVRARICDGLGFLGVGIDKARNSANADVISAEGPVSVRVMHTDEQTMIARAVCRLPGFPIGKEVVHG